MKTTAHRRPPARSSSLPSMVGRSPTRRPARAATRLLRHHVVTLASDLDGLRSEVERHASQASSREALAAQPVGGNGAFAGLPENWVPIPLSFPQVPPYVLLVESHRAARHPRRRVPQGTGAQINVVGFWLIARVRQARRRGDRRGRIGGSLPLAASAAGAWGWVVPPGEPATEVGPAVHSDNLADALGWTRVAAIKIDVEGAELRDCRTGTHPVAAGRAGRYHESHLTPIITPAPRPGRSWRRSRRTGIAATRSAPGV